MRSWLELGNKRAYIKLLPKCQEGTRCFSRGRWAAFKAMLAPRSSMWNLKEVGEYQGMGSFNAYFFVPSAISATDILLVEDPTGVNPMYDY